MCAFPLCVTQGGQFHQKAVSSHFEPEETSIQIKPRVSADTSKGQGSGRVTKYPCDPALERGGARDREKSETKFSMLKTANS